MKVERIAYNSWSVSEEAPAILDEAVVLDVSGVHLERLSAAMVWVGLYDAGKKRSFHINFLAKRDGILDVWIENDLKDDKGDENQTD